MAFVHGRKSKVKVNAVDLTNYIEEASLSNSVETAETTTLGKDSKTYIAGLKDATFSCSGKYDAAASAVDVTIQALLQAAEFQVKFQPDGSSSSLSSTNPAYTFQAILTSYEVSASVGDVITFSAEFQVSGDVSRTVTGTF